MARQVVADGQDMATGAIVIGTVLDQVAPPSNVANVAPSDWKVTQWLTEPQTTVPPGTTALVVGPELLGGTRTGER